MTSRNTRFFAGLFRGRGYRLWLLPFFAAAIFIFLGSLLGSISCAAEPLHKYQIVNGSDDKAYLLDTTSGFVWVLTYRTIATGREPIAIPYKFIRTSPKDKKDFLIEDMKGEPCLPGK
jgi:hypothetical protein